MQEVLIPKNVDIEESLLQDQNKIRKFDLVNPSIQDEEFEVGFAPPSPDMLAMQKRELALKEGEIIKRQHRKQQKKAVKENFEPLQMATDNHISSINYNDYVFRRYGKIMKFFDRKLSKCVNYLRKVIVFCSLIWFVYSVYLGSNIPQQITKETLLSSESSPIQQAKDIIDYRIWKEDNYMGLSIIFGVQSRLY